MFLQLHALTSYPGTLLNRDDAGFAKRLPFGGATRTRVSSQCLKYHWRNFDGENALYHIPEDLLTDEEEGLNGTPKSLRSRETFRREVAQKLEGEGHPKALVRATTFAVKELVVTGKTPGKKDTKNALTASTDKEVADVLDTKQVTILGTREMDYLRTLAGQVVADVVEQFPAFGQASGDGAAAGDGASGDAEEEKGGMPEGVDTGDVADAIRKHDALGGRDMRKNLTGMRLAAGLDAALFGRMATSDVLARGDAAIHVAHALTTHAEASESDYFSAVDELRRDEPEESGEMGAGHINSQELTSGLFYTYVVIDVPLLVANLEGCAREAWTEADPTLAAEVVRRFVHLMATVSPGAKLGSTAPYGYALALLAEAGTAQPRTLANAFQKPVSTAGDVLESSLTALAGHVERFHAMYGPVTETRLATMGDGTGLLAALGLEATTPVSAIADWAVEKVTTGEAHVPAAA